MFLPLNWYRPPRYNGLDSSLLTPELFDTPCTRLFGEGTGCTPLTLVTIAGSGTQLARPDQVVPLRQKPPCRGPTACQEVSRSAINQCCQARSSIISHCRHLRVPPPAYRVSAPCRPVVLARMRKAVLQLPRELTAPAECPGSRFRWCWRSGMPGGLPAADWRPPAVIVVVPPGTRRG